MYMKKVLVTGATGFLGKYLIEELLNNDYEVVAQGRKENVLNGLKEKYNVYKYSGQIIWKFKQIIYSMLFTKTPSR